MPAVEVSALLTGRAVAASHRHTQYLITYGAVFALQQVRSALIFVCDVVSALLVCVS